MIYASCGNICEARKILQRCLCDAHRFNLENFAAIVIRRIASIDVCFYFTLLSTLYLFCIFIFIILWDFLMRFYEANLMTLFLHLFMHESLSVCLVILTQELLDLHSRRVLRMMWVYAFDILCSVPHWSINGEGSYRFAKVNKTCVNQDNKERIFSLWCVWAVELIYQALFHTFY